MLQLNADIFVTTTLFVPSWHIRYSAIFVVKLDTRTFVNLKNRNLFFLKQTKKTLTAQNVTVDFS